MRNVPALHSGYSLAELLIVVALLGLIAAAAVPRPDVSVDQKLEASARLFADVIRFARNESMRTGDEYGFHRYSGQERLRVFRLDRVASPPTIVYDVYHPVSKSIYDVKLRQISFADLDNLSATALFDGICHTPDQIFFDRHGVARCVEPENVMLTNFEAEIALGSEIRSVMLEGRTGRVTVQ